MKRLVLIVSTLLSFLVGYVLYNKKTTENHISNKSAISQKLLLKVRFDTQVSNSLMVCPYQNNAELPNVTPYKHLLVNDTDTLLQLANVANTGENALIDLVLVSLRNDTGVIQTRSAIVQADGDVVGLDGISALTFSVSGNYYISIHHRNSLAFRTLNKVNIANDTKYFDFTNNSVPLYGNTPLKASGGYFVMIGGDANGDGSIDALDHPIWVDSNGLWGGYGLSADFNLDGSVDALDSIPLENHNGLYADL